MSLYIHAVSRIGLAILASVALCGCHVTGKPQTFYALVPVSRVSLFPVDLAKVANLNGLAVARGQATETTGTRYTWSRPSRL